MALLKERLKNGEQVLGTMVTTFASPDIAKILQSCGWCFTCFKIIVNLIP